MSKLLLLLSPYSEVVAGMEFTGDDETSPDGDEQFSRQEIAAALDSIGYIAREHPDYVPRYVLPRYLKSVSSRIYGMC